MRYFFNIKDSVTTLDAEGLEFGSMDQAKTEAIQTTAQLMTGARGELFWSGEPWLLWVTDQPNGKGNTVLTLTFSAQVTA